ncbi:DUF1289 domain-containing protein [Variovorax sp. HJSM1_2]|uniref:DUF1289 domain-containing protein n=1 Tax=Variovorax sp. HJSM1_2 TaxID=3366263 RepID=UPI003BEDB38A
MTPRQQLRTRALAAQALPADAVEVLSPCVSVCRMSPATALCEGCLRTIGEIADWSRMAPDGKRVVWARIEERLAACAA